MTSISHSPRFSGRFTATFENRKYPPHGARYELFSVQDAGTTMRNSYGFTDFRDDNTEHLGSGSYRAMTVTGHVPDAKAEGLDRFVRKTCKGSFEHTPDQS